MDFSKMGEGESKKIEGYYISQSGNKYKFITSPFEGNVMLMLQGGSSLGLNNAFGVTSVNNYYTYILLTNNAFELFKQNVLDKDMEWKKVEQIKNVPNVPGKWMSTKGMERMEFIKDDKERAKAESSISGTERTHPHTTAGTSGEKTLTAGSTRRKSTKRRRNRRGNRKTKKN